MTQLEYIRLDTDFFDKPKIKGLIYRHGQEAVGFLLRLLCSMGRATDGGIGRDAWEAIGIESNIDPQRAETLVVYCLEQGILEGDLSMISNSRVQADREALEKKRGAARERVRTHRQKHQEPNAPAYVARMERAVAVSNHPQPVSVPSPVLVVAHSPVEDVQEFDTSDPNLKIALEKLESPSGQPWTHDNRYMSAGRRPMKDYPALWLTPFELADVVKKLEESQIPVQAYKDLFLKAEARLKTYTGQGRSTQGVSVYNWMTGFLFDELLERTIKETRLAKTIEGPKRYEQRR
jgi:hypothetical protein